MAQAPDRDEKAAILAVLNEINDAWLNGRPEDIVGRIAPHFHDDMVMKGPGFVGLPCGRNACARSYEDFVRQAGVREYKSGEPTIDITGDTAVAVYSWKMTYELSGAEYRETGHDLFVFVRERGSWLAVWRAILPGS